MAFDFTLAVGELRVAVTCTPAEVGLQLEKRYQGFTQSSPPDWKVSINWIAQEEAPAFLFTDPIFEGQMVRFIAPNYEGEIDLAAGTARLAYKSFLVLEDAEYFLRVVCTLLAFKRGGLLFHAAGIQRETCGYAFFGLSGSGKTTIARNSPVECVLNDDLLLLQPTKLGWMMYATPFWNPSQVVPRPLNAPLTALLRLVQDKTVRLERLEGAAAYAELLASVPVINQNLAQTTELLKRIKQLLTEVPAYRLHFLPDESFWDIVLPLGIK